MNLCLWRNVAGVSVSRLGTSLRWTAGGVPSRPSLSVPLAFLSPLSALSRRLLLLAVLFLRPSDGGSSRGLQSLGPSGSCLLRLGM